MALKKIKSYWDAPGIVMSLPSESDKINFIIKACCDHFNIPIEDVLKKNRKREIVECRHHIAYFVRANLNITLQKIAELFTFNDVPMNHASIIHSIKFINNLTQTDRSFNFRFVILEKEINQKFKIWESQKAYQKAS